MHHSTPLLFLVGLLIAPPYSFGQNSDFPLIAERRQAAQELEQKARAENDSLMLAEAYYLYGKMYAFVGDHAASKTAFLNSLRILEPRGDSYELGRIYVRLCENSITMHSAEEIRYAYLARAVFERMGSLKGQVLAYSVLAQIYERRHPHLADSSRPDSSLIYLRLARRLNGQLRDTLGMADLSLKIGEIYVMRNDRRAIPFLENTLHWLELKPNLRTQLNTLIMLGRAHLNAGQVVQGLDRINEAQKVYDRNQLNDHLVSTNLDRAMINYYEKTRQWQQAYKQLGKLYKKENINYAAERDGAIARLQVEYETHKKEAALQAKNLELALTNENFRQQRLFVLVVSGLFLTAAILSVLFFRLYRRYQRTSQQNEYLVRELSHRSRNNLQRIMSLLGMQGRLLADPLSKQAIEDSRLRVQSMSLIQNRLYDEEGTHTFELANLIPELTENALHACGYDHITPVYHMSDITLDTDRAVSLGLILTELVTNACKHAFPFTSRPSITISCFQRDRRMINFTLTDNGPGWVPEAGASSVADSLGLALIQLQVEQLRGQCTFTYENGTRFTLNFKNPPS